MDLFTVSLSWVPDDVSVYFQGFLSFSAIVFAFDRYDARQQVVEFCKKHFNACSFINVRVKKLKGGDTYQKRFSKAF